MPNDAHTNALVDLLLATADDKLMLGHRNSDWTGLAPILEEDIAFSSIAQDDMAHAQSLYELAAELTGKTADEIAYGRSENEYRCATLFELSDDFDWATAIVRQFFGAHFQALRLGRMVRSSDTRLAALAKRLRAEQQVEVEHVDHWMVRLAKGTDESRQRVQKALDTLAPHAVMLCEATAGEDQLAKAGIYPPLEDGRAMFDAWRERVKAVLDEAGLEATLDQPAPDTKGGRRGVHSDEFKAVLDEMCEVYRLEPGGAW